MPHETVTELGQLIERVKSYNVEADLDLVRRAYDFSAKAHEGQTRRSGEPYFRHPLAVAGLLTHLKTDVTAIVAGLLHDTLEDTLATPHELEQRFGKDVVHLVDGVTKIGKITFRNYEEKQAENFRKMVLSMADDIRVVLIKLADRLHNMRTLEYLSEGKRQQIAQETLEIYAPLANRLGIGWIKNELEDLCLKHLKPDVYEMLRVRVAKRDEDRQQYILEVMEMVKRAMVETGLQGEVSGRPKHLYGIYQKMEKQSISFEEVYDLAALRIITDTKMNCYALLGSSTPSGVLCRDGLKTISRFRNPTCISHYIPRWLVPKASMWSFRSVRRRCIASPSRGSPPTGNTKSMGVSMKRTARCSVGCGNLWSGTKTCRTIASSWTRSNSICFTMSSMCLLPKAWSRNCPRGLRPSILPIRSIRKLGITASGRRSTARSCR